MTKIALGIEYIGTNYNGWQRQSHTRSIQAEVEQALGYVADTRIEVFCAGRTDSGVHATGQVIHFEYENSKPNKLRRLDAWVLGGNSNLPDDISINWAKEVPDDFHARFSAHYRRYQYYIYTNKVARASLYKRALWLRKELDTSAMQDACKYLLGEQDFSSLRSSQCESSTPFRNIIAADIKLINNFIVFDVTANAFLHHMVRNIVGCLLEIGANNKTPTWFKEVLNLKDRTKASATAPPEGLYLVNVGYPENYILNNTLYLPFNS